MRQFQYLVLIVVILLVSQAGLAQSVVPRFESSPCAIAVPPTEKHVECGYLVVLENRSAKTERTIRLPIAILKTESSAPKPDPVLKTLGGPGGSSLKMIGARRSSPWLKDRDYIIFEQRGTKFAQPSLECPEVDNSTSNSAKNNIDRFTARKDLLAAARTCFDRLTRSGADLNAYNSAESAADIEDLRRVLRIDKINLYGVSYSARLMLDVMRYFPKGIRSVVLESTLPPDVNYDEVGVDGVVRVFDQLFSACGNDAECKAAYPGLEKEFYAVVARLNKQPLTVQTKDPATAAVLTISLTGDDFATWIVDYLFSNEPSATVNAPYVVHQAFNGTFVKPFLNYAGDKLGGSSYSWGMRYSVWCREEFPFEDIKKIKAQSTKFAGLFGYEVMALPDICGVWKVAPALKQANQPVKSGLPTLVLSAQYDAYTDPAWGRATAKNMKNSFYFEIPWAGHGPAFSVPCVNMMISEFIDSPAIPPKVNCVEATRRQFKFVTKMP